MSRRPRSVCVVAAASLKAAPDDAAEQVTQVLFGEAVSVEDERDGWAHVRTSYDYPGWIRREALSSGDPLAEARAYLGAPYEWGGMTERGIDCSGLVHMAFRRTGMTVPRDADQQEEAARAVDASDLRPGDLITYGAGSADHIAFWAGDGRILHATGREGVDRVVEEAEPESLALRRRKLVRFEHSLDSGNGLT
jgi:gamma-D-glutamyl-L-lysine dipeptidyl-peptidase